MCVWFSWQYLNIWLKNLHSSICSPQLKIQLGSLTSFVVLTVSAESFHGYVTTCSPPSWLAHTVPAILVQCASPIAVAQTRAALCWNRQRKSTSDLNIVIIQKEKKNNTNKGHLLGTGLKNSTNTVIAHGVEQQHYLGNIILNKVASLIGLTLETPLTCTGRK